MFSWEETPWQTLLEELHISLAQERLRSPQEELENIAVWCTLLSLLPPRPDPG